MHEASDDCRCTTDAPCPARKEPLTMVGPAYRAVAHPEHVEFSPTHAREERNPQGWSRVDGLKKLDGSEIYVVSRLYRKHIGTLPNGEDIYFVGEYVGNRRVKMTNEESPLVVGTTWQIFLQEDKDLDTPVECYRLCDLEVVDGAGTKLVEANDYKPKRPEVMMYYDEAAPPKPELKLAVTHPQHGGGEVVRVTGTGEVWYAAVRYDWPSVDAPPLEGALVRRQVKADDGRGFYVYGEVDEVDAGMVTVVYENGREHKSMQRDFYRTYQKIVEISSKHFYDVFGLEHPGRKLTVRARRIGRDTRTANERAFAAPSRSTMAFSALIAANTPDSGHFVPDRRNDSFRPGSGFRWHRERALPPKNEDFAPLVGRPKKVPRPKRGWSYDRLNRVREQLALAPAPTRKALPEARRGGIWDGELEGAPKKDVELSPSEWRELHGKTVMF